MSKMLKVVGASWLQTKVSSYILGILGVLSIMALFVGQIERTQEDGIYAATVFWSEKTGYRIEYWGQSNQLSDIPRGVARAYFKVDGMSAGWSLLEIESDESYPDRVQAYAAGILEGALTWYPIHAHLENTVRERCEQREKQCGKLRDALEQAAGIWKARAAEREMTDPFWHHVSLYYQQLSGIFTGWKHGIDRSLNEFETEITDLYWLNAMADTKEIQRKLNITIDDSPLNALPGLSTAFMRVVYDEYPDKGVKKMFVAQNAAGSYSSMTRILKRYKLNFHMTAADNSPPARANVVEFSGYPGSVTSQDEFYMIRGQPKHFMTVTGTPLNNYNNKLWKDVNITQQLPIGPRLTAANRLAANVSDWGHLIASSNSGTACKQWLVADFNYLKNITHPINLLQELNTEDSQNNSKRDLVTEVSFDGNNREVRHTVVHRMTSSKIKGLLWLIEQVPGRTHSADISEAFLEKGYWATFGLPFFKDIADVTNISDMKEMYGNIFSESDSPRAITYKENFLNATTLDAFIRLMRHNMTLAHKSDQVTDKQDLSDNFKELCKDDVTGKDKVNCILNEELYMAISSSRGDLASNYKEAYGVIDTKIIGGSEDSIDFIAISGPQFSQDLKKNSTETFINKGNIISSSIHAGNTNTVQLQGLEIRDLVKSTSETYKTIQPFQWSKSEFEGKPHIGLPDKWAFNPIIPEWSW